MAAIQFTYTTQPVTLTTGKLIPELNKSLRGLAHDLDKHVVFSDTSPRTISAAHQWSTPVVMQKVTAPATLANVAQLYYDTADGHVKVRLGTGTTLDLGGP